MYFISADFPIDWKKMSVSLTKSVLNTGNAYERLLTLYYYNQKEQTILTHTISICLLLMMTRTISCEKASSEVSTSWSLCTDCPFAEKKHFRQMDFSQVLQ